MTVKELRKEVTIMCRALGIGTHEPEWKKRGEKVLEAITSYMKALDKDTQGMTETERNHFERKVAHETTQQYAREM